MSKDPIIFDLFTMDLTGRDSFPFSVSVNSHHSVVGVFRDKEFCRKCCEALNRSVLRIVRSWHLKEYGSFSSFPSSISSVGDSNE